MFFLLLGFLLPAAAGSARTWTIQADGGGDAPTIQAGIDASADGDTVLALPGTYYENINFLGKTIVVMGSGPAVTTIDGSTASESCVRFVTGEGRDSVLEGFEITGGRGHIIFISKPFGGGVCIVGAEPTIRDNHIVLNSTEAEDGDGGGIYASASGITYSPLIESNVISGNTCGVNGGGIGIFGTMAPIIRDNVVSGNTTGEGDGAGVWLLLATSGTQVSGNQIVGNIAGDHAAGILIGGQGTTNPQVEIYENLVADNVAYFNSVIGQHPTGGGMWVSDAQAWIHNNTIVENEAVVGMGGGIAIYRGAGVVIEKNILAMTVAGGGITCEVDDQAVIKNNLAWNNTDEDGSGFCGEWALGNGNLVADPQFCNPAAGDYTLAEGSPALTHPAGPLGAYPTPGCPPVPITPTTWGRIKSQYE